MDRRRSMSDGGYEHDLREAENAMAAAGHPDIALGMRRHSEAQRNMMQGVLVPMFVQMVERALDTKLAPLVTSQKETQDGVAALSGLFQSLAESVDGLQVGLRESQEDRAAIHEELAAVKADIVELQTQFTAYVSGSKRNDLEEMRAQLAEIRGDYTPEQRAHLTGILLRMIADYEAAHGDGE
jgi:septal ring factor EnvC (AmiA/AmiB activator)